MQTKFLIINVYITFANPTSYYSSFTEGSWEQSEFMSWQFLLHCLEMDQCNGICELKPSQLQSPWKESAWLDILTCSFSQQTFFEDSFCVDAGDRSVNKTQTEQIPTLKQLIVQWKSILDAGLIGPVFYGLWLPEKQQILHWWVCFFLKWCNSYCL